MCFSSNYILWNTILSSKRWVIEFHHFTETGERAQNEEQPIRISFLLNNSLTIPKPKTLLKRQNFYFFPYNEVYRNLSSICYCVRILSVNSIKNIQFRITVLILSFSIFVQLEADRFHLYQVLIHSYGKWSVWDQTKSIHHNPFNIHKSFTLKENFTIKSTNNNISRSWQTRDM